MREKEREREKERRREGEKERRREREGEREAKEKERGKEREKERGKDREKERGKKGEKESEGERRREKERGRDGHFAMTRSACSMLWRWPARRYQKPCKPYTGQTNNPQVHHSSGKEPRSIAEHCRRVSSHCFLNKQTVFSRLKSCFQKVFPERFLHFDLLLEILLNWQHRLKDLLDSKPKSSIFRNCF